MTGRIFHISPDAKAAPSPAESPESKTPAPERPSAYGFAVDLLSDDDGEVQFRPQDEPRPGRGGRQRLWRILIVLLLLLAAAGAAWHVRLRDRAATPDFVTVAVSRGNIEDSIMATGTLQPLNSVEVGTQVSGQLEKVYVELGDVVVEGDLLAEIDPTIFRAQVQATEAQLENLRAQQTERQAQLQLAQQLFARQERLMAAEATSQEAYQSAEAALTSAEAQLAALAAQIENVESSLEADRANLGYTKIFAPMAGTVVSQTATQGQTLNANQQAPIILSVADLSTMTVWTQVSEADISDLRPGMDVYFTTLGDSDRRWQGKLRKILPTPEVVNNVVLYNALFDVPNPTGELMTQMTAQVFFVKAAAREVLTVPLAALKSQPITGSSGNATNGPPAHSVQVMRADGTVAERPVEVGVTNRVAAEIIEGLSENERVVVGPQPKSSDRVSGFTRPARLS